jgi:hypothetical protein
MLGEEWLREISINMDPEEGRLWVIGIGEDRCPAFTEYGVECLKANHHQRACASRAKAQGSFVASTALTRGLLAVNADTEQWVTSGATFECVSRQMNRWGFEHDK